MTSAHGDFGRGKAGDVPADSGTRHRRDDAGGETTEEAFEAIATMDDGCCVPETLGTTELGVTCGATGLQQRLDHVQRRRDPGCNSTRQPTGNAVSGGIVAFRRIHDLGDGLVGGELEGREGNRHRERRGIRDVEGGETLGTVDRAGTLGDGLVDRAVDLHALFDDYAQVVSHGTSVLGPYVTGDLPSKGFMMASLAVVAHAPLTAAASSVTGNTYLVLEGPVPAAKG